jgi:hypothetical protein
MIRVENKTPHAKSIKTHAGFRDVPRKPAAIFLPVRRGALPRTNRKAEMVDKDN